MIIAVDFDSTIHNPFEVKKGYKMGVPIKDSIESIRKLKSEGHYVIIFPTWADTIQKRQAIVDWLDYFKVPYDDVTSTKPDADVYIDDRGLRFTTWENTLVELEKINARLS
jgi:hypothetical protein